MPITPIHFGIGALPGGYTSRWVSFRTFVFANVVIDLEAIYRIPLGLYPIHDWMHTFVVGVVVPLGLVVPVGRPFCLWVSRWWNRHAKGGLLEWVRIPEVIRLGPAIGGVFLGSVSHVFLDGIMHSDMRPLRPFSEANPFYALIGVGLLHGLLIAGGVIGLMLFLYRTRKTAPDP